MSKLEILDLSFCKLATQQEMEIKGGLRFAYPVHPDLLNLINSILYPELDNSSDNQPDSKEDFIVDKFEDKKFGKYGYVVSNRKGNSRAGIVVGPNYTGSFASSHIST